MMVMCEPCGQSAGFLNAIRLNPWPEHSLCIPTTGTESLWPLLFAFNALPSLLCLVAMPFCPESPRYLLIKKNLEEEARKGRWFLIQSMQGQIILCRICTDQPAQKYGLQDQGYLILKRIFNIFRIPHNYLKCFKFLSFPD